MVSVETSPAQIERYHAPPADTVDDAASDELTAPLPTRQTVRFLARDSFQVLDPGALIIGYLRSHFSARGFKLASGVVAGGGDVGLLQIRGDGLAFAVAGVRVGWAFREPLCLPAAYDPAWPEFAGGVVTAVVADGSGGGWYVGSFAAVAGSVARAPWSTCSPRALWTPR